MEGLTLDLSSGLALRVVSSSTALGSTLGLGAYLKINKINKGMVSTKRPSQVIPSKSRSFHMPVTTLFDCHPVVSTTLNYLVSLLPVCTSVPLTALSAASDAK